MTGPWRLIPRGLYVSHERMKLVTGGGGSEALQAFNEQIAMAVPVAVLTELQRESRMEAMKETTQRSAR